MKLHKYYVYILTNKNKFTFYIGVTNDLERRMIQHKHDSDSAKKSFAGRYNCIYLIYFEEYQWIQVAIAREKELKKWNRDKKLNLIKNTNPRLEFLNTWE
jgi:putative endonuclease